MKILKSVVACVLALALVLSFAGCHGANEVAVSYENIEFTSGVYALALLNADSEARSLIDAENTDNQTEIDYLIQKVEDKPFEQWVKDRAMQSLAMQAAYRKLCAENGLKLEGDELKQVEDAAKYYYSYYEALLAQNGIGEKSYAELMKGDTLGDKYFMFLYGKDGEKEVKEDELKTFYNTNYRTVLLLQGSYASLKDEEKADLKAKLEASKARLDKGDSIIAVYNEFNEVTDENAADEEKDVMALLANGEVDSQYGFAKWNEIKDLKPGNTVFIDSTDESCFYVVKVVDTSAEASYFTDLKDTLLRTLKDEEYNEYINEYTKTLTPNVNKYAIGAFKVKNIKY